MSSLQRLQWLLGEVHNGRNAHVTFSYNVQYTREKVKFVLEESYAAGGVYRPCVMAAHSASAGSPTRLSSTDVQQEQRQQSSSFPRDIQRTAQLASPRKKKSKKH